MNKPQSPRFKILNEREKTEITRMLKNQFGITELPGILLQRGSERLFLYQGDLVGKELENLEKTFILERVGIYFAKIVPGENKIRLSIDGVHIIKDQITKNIFELTDEQAKHYLQGEELYIETPEEERRFVIMKYKNDFWGTGKASAEKISNFIPKARRIKNKENK